MRNEELGGGEGATLSLFLIPHYFYMLLRSYCVFSVKDFAAYFVRSIYLSISGLVATPF